MPPHPDRVRGSYNDDQFNAEPAITFRVISMWEQDVRTVLDELEKPHADAFLILSNPSIILAIRRLRLLVGGK